MSCMQNVQQRTRTKARKKRSPSSIYTHSILLGITPAVANTSAAQPVPQGRGAAHRPPFQSSRQHDAKSIHARDDNTSAKRHDAVKHSGRVDVAPEAPPLDTSLGLGQRGRGEPPHGELERQRLAGYDARRLGALHVAQRAGAVGNGRVEDAAVVRPLVVLGHAVQQDVHVRADVHVAHLQRARQRKHQRHVLLRRRLLADDFHVRRRPGREAARHGRVAVDVELEQVEEGVRDEVERAVELALVAVVEFERLARLVAHGERDPLYLVVLLNVLAGFSVAFPC